MDPQTASACSKASGLPHSRLLAFERDQSTLESLPLKSLLPFLKMSFKDLIFTNNKVMTCIPEKEKKRWGWVELE